jgi:5'-nucleotidase
MMLEKNLPSDVQILKVDVPAGATLQTPWEITRLSMQRYYEAQPTPRASWDLPGPMGYHVHYEPLRDSPGTDTYAIHVKKVISVTPLTLDMTSRVDLKELENYLKNP